MTYGVLVLAPMIFVWIIVILDLEVRRDLSVKAKAAWLAAVTLVWPTMILYLLLRPVQGRLVRQSAVRREHPDRRQSLVDAALDHEAGRLSAQEFGSAANRLRRPPRK